MMQGDPQRAWERLGTVVDRARRAGDEHLWARARTSQLGVESLIMPDGYPARVEADLPGLEVPLVAASDFVGLSALRMLRAQPLMETGRFDEAALCVREAIEFAERSDDRQLEEGTRIALLNCLIFGSATPDEVLALGNDLLPSVSSKASRTLLLAPIALAHATAGQLGEAREIGQELEESHRELGMLSSLPYLYGERAHTALWSGNDAAAEGFIRQAIDGFEASGSQDWSDYFLVGLYAEVLVRQGRAAEVQAMLDLRRDDLRITDPRTPVLASIADLESLVALGRRDEAARALASIDASIPVLEAPVGRSWNLVRIAGSAAALGEADLARRLAAEALSVAEGKGFVPGMSRARALLAELGAT
jgi:hypothetical protein